MYTITFYAIFLCMYICIPAIQRYNVVVELGKLVMIRYAALSMACGKTLSTSVKCPFKQNITHSHFHSVRQIDVGRAYQLQ